MTGGASLKEITDYAEATTATLDTLNLQAKIF
jgi:hypothetical protein